MLRHVGGFGVGACGLCVLFIGSVGVWMVLAFVILRLFVYSVGVAGAQGMVVGLVCVLFATLLQFGIVGVTLGNPNPDSASSDLLLRCCCRMLLSDVVVVVVVVLFCIALVLSVLRTSSFVWPGCPVSGAGGCDLPPVGCASSCGKWFRAMVDAFVCRCRGVSG